MLLLFVSLSVRLINPSATVTLPLAPNNFCSNRGCSGYSHTGPFVAMSAPLASLLTLPPMIYARIAAYLLTPPHSRLCCSRHYPKSTCYLVGIASVMITNLLIFISCCRSCRYLRSHCLARHPIPVPCVSTCLTLLMIVRSATFDSPLPLSLTIP
jgi:hypothetical protein